MHRSIRTFATTALFEGISYILLLAIAMPLKYLLDFPYAVKALGWAHGVLFILYVTLLVICWIKHRWSVGRVLLYFAASLLPFLPFVVERRLKREYGLT